MPAVPGLRSPYAQVGRIVYFGRMLDKIRLHAEGALPADYVSNLGAPRPVVFDARCTSFLGIAYDALRDRVLAGGADEECLAWAEANGRRRSDEDCAIWNGFMTKLGWRDERTPVLEQRIRDAGLEGHGIATMFDFLDVDEGRDPSVLRERLRGRKPSLLVVMGVAGAGKTTVGRALAQSLGCTFADADDYHPASNVEKMRAGIPLTDADRAPWLQAVAQVLNAALEQDQSLVLACSALKRDYRRILAPDATHTRFIHLHGDPAVIEARLRGRTRHFANATLLPSQLATLEAPREALRVDIDAPVEQQVADIRQRLGL